ncbi:hypothetical protein [Micromonospora sp. NPDC049102]|uniref:hypothetical protein n=1 Tax=Micromonospora sp. NPDC049102 TaxID=3364265 RepID=UPI00372251F2
MQHERDPLLGREPFQQHPQGGADLVGADRALGGIGGIPTTLVGLGGRMVRGWAMIRG